jgi:hypothetical protein
VSGVPPSGVGYRRPRSRCLVCGGRIHDAGLVAFQDRWLHTYDSDWVDNPHNAVPVCMFWHDGDERVVAAALVKAERWDPANKRYGPLHDLISACAHHADGDPTAYALEASHV